MDRKVPLAELLEDLKDKRGLSVRAMAEKIGISHPTMLDILKGKSVPSPATVRKIAAWSGLPEDYLLRLAGHLGPAGARNSELEVAAEYRRTRQQMRVKSVPLLGRIPASWPNYQEETLEGFVSVAEEVARGRDLFALRVHGWSMVDAGINEGDIVLVDADCPLTIGDVVVADVDGEQTVKWYGGHSRGQVKLVPANHDMEPFLVPASQFRCIGVVIEIHKPPIRLR